MMQNNECVGLFNTFVVLKGLRAPLDAYFIKN